MKGEGPSLPCRSQHIQSDDSVGEHTVTPTKGSRANLGRKPPGLASSNGPQFPRAVRSKFSQSTDQITSSTSCETQSSRLFLSPAWCLTLLVKRTFQPHSHCNPMVSRELTRSLCRCDNQRDVTNPKRLRRRNVEARSPPPCPKPFSRPSQNLKVSPQSKSGAACVPALPQETSSPISQYLISGDSLLKDNDSYLTDGR